MSPRVFVTSGLTLATLVLSACSSGGGYGAAPGQVPTQGPSAAPVGGLPSPLPSAQSGTKINVATSRLGPILVDAKGRTLYLFRLDSGTSSTCNSTSCVQNWPPVLTSG